MRHTMEIFYGFCCFNPSPSLSPKGGGASVFRPPSSPFPLREGGRGVRCISNPFPKRSGASVVSHVFHPSSSPFPLREGGQGVRWISNPSRSILTCHPPIPVPRL